MPKTKKSDPASNIKNTLIDLEADFAIIKKEGLILKRDIMRLTDKIRINQLTKKISDQ